MAAVRLLLFIVVAVGAVVAQERAQPLFKSDAAAVVVDVIVRDDHGKPVTDLTERDFQLFENGAPQDIASMTLVAPGHVRSTSGPDRTPDQNVTLSRQHEADIGVSPSFVALVFDRLAPDARALAYKAALASVDANGATDFVGVFQTDLSLAVLQNYTNDKRLIRDALHQVGTRATSVFDRTATRAIAQSMAIGDAHPSIPVVASPEEGGRPVNPTDSFLTALAVTTRNSWETLARDQQGYATTDALMAVAAGLGRLPGRKTMIFFAEGLSIPEAVLPKFRDVVATANRMNVTIYTIDAAGLRVHSKDAETGREVRAMGLAGMAVNPDGSSQSTLAMMERNEDVLRKNPRTGLELLSGPTGGFLIENTNDLRQGLASINADRRFHYLLTYAPKNQHFDGKWRSVLVRVPGRQVYVRARAGYVAVRGASGMPLLTYEAPAVAALDVRPLPRQLAFKATGLALLSRSGDPRVAVVVSADASGLTFNNTGNDAFTTDFTIVARIKDAQGTVIRKASEPYRLSGPMSSLDRARKGSILFFRQPELPPGSYMLEAAIYDQMSGKAGARFIPFTVFEPSPHGLLVSSLVLVERTERAGDVKPEDTNPLIAGGLLVYPRVGDPYRKTVDSAISLFVRLKVPKGMAVPAAMLVLLRNGQPAATLPVSLPVPDENGVIDRIAQLTLEPLPVGNFTLQLIVNESGDEIVREVPVQVVE